jgi:hypothetical protein
MALLWPCEDWEFLCKWKPSCEYIRFCPFPAKFASSYIYIYIIYYHIDILYVEREAEREREDKREREGE